MRGKANHVPGVSWDTGNRAYKAYIKMPNGKVKVLGRFKQEWDAICARKSADHKFGKS
jgi:hypothetical protein